MKKSFLALAGAAALAVPLAPQADTILYGSARVEVDYVSNEFRGVIIPEIQRLPYPPPPFPELIIKENYWDVVNGFSRLGVRGEEDLGGGLSAVYQYEFGVDVTEGGNFESNRPKFVGLKGGFGKLTVGTQFTPYYEAVGVNDIFNSVWTFGSRVWLGGSGRLLYIDDRNPFTSESGSVKRLDNSVYYSTPDFNGMSASAMLVMDGSLNKANGWSDGIDWWSVALKYSKGPFFVGATYIAVNGSELPVGYPDFRLDYFELDLDQWGIGLAYEAGAFSLGLTYERGTVNQWGILEPVWREYNRRELGIDGIDDTPWSAYLTGSYTFGNNIISVAYGQLETGFAGDDLIQNYVLSYQYNLSKRTRLWFEYVGSSADTFFYGDLNVVSIGTRVDF